MSAQRPTKSRLRCRRRLRRRVLADLRRPHVARRLHGVTTAPTPVHRVGLAPARAMVASLAGFALVLCAGKRRGTGANQDDGFRSVLAPPLRAINRHWRGALDRRGTPRWSEVRRPRRRQLDPKVKAAHGDRCVLQALTTLRRSRLVESAWVVAVPAIGADGFMAYARREADDAPEPRCRVRLSPSQKLAPREISRNFKSVV